MGSKVKVVLQNWLILHIDGASAVKGLRLQPAQQNKSLASWKIYENQRIDSLKKSILGTPTTFLAMAICLKCILTFIVAFHDTCTFIVSRKSSMHFCQSRSPLGLL